MSTLWKSSSKQSNQGFRTKEVSIQSADLWFEKVRKGEILRSFHKQAQIPFLEAWRSNSRQQRLGTRHG